MNVIRGAASRAQSGHSGSSVNDGVLPAGQELQFCASGKPSGRAAFVANEAGLASRGASWVSVASVDLAVVSRTASAIRLGEAVSNEQCPAEKMQDVMGASGCTEV